MLVLREISKFDLRLARYTREQSPAVKFIINKYSNHVEYRPFFCRVRSTLCRCYSVVKVESLSTLNMYAYIRGNPNHPQKS